MEDEKICIYGDGCLMRIKDTQHDISYKHDRPGLIPKCSLGGECEKYILAYEYIRKDLQLTPGVKEAQIHSSLNYHPPITSNDYSKNVKKTRPRSISISNTNSIPKLDLTSVGNKFISTKKSVSDPNRSKIAVSPKNKEVLEMKQNINNNKIIIDCIKEDVKDLKRDIETIKELLLGKILT